MGVKNTHPQYDKYVGKWQRCRDVASGQDAVHAAGVRYLPQLKDQLTPEYESYKARALFYNATWRTIDGLRGMIFQKPPKVEVPESIKPLMTDITLDGRSVEMFLMEVVEEDLKTGRFGILVDYPMVEVDGYTLADAKADMLRPFMRGYLAEHIRYWETRSVNNKVYLSLVILEECAAEKIDEFSSKTKTQYRVLALDDAGYYNVRLYEVNSAGEDVLLAGPIYPLMGNAPLTEIPFFFIGVDDNTPQCDDPPLIDLVDVNLSHYRSTADYEHGCHFTGLPTPWISGHTSERDAQGNPTKLYIGSTHAWVFPGENTKVGFLEFSGSGLSVLVTNLERKENMMAVIGARMLEQQKRQVETAEVAALHRAGENSTLSMIAQSISAGFTRALACLALWGGAAVRPESDDVEAELNRDFFPIPMDAQTITAMVGAWQKGAFSHQTLHENFQKREVVPKDRTFEDEKALIDAEGPKLSAGLPGMIPPLGGLLPVKDPIEDDEEAK